MDERDRSVDVDKMVSDFLSELNALGESLRSAGENPAGASGVRQVVTTEDPPGARPGPAAAPAPIEAENESAPLAARPVRNIDVLLMDDVPSTPVEETAGPNEFPRTCKALHDLLLRRQSRASSWWRHALLWLAASIALLCLMGALNHLL